MVKVSHNGVASMTIDVLANDIDIDSDKDSDMTNVNYTENCKIGDSGSTEASLTARAARLKKQSTGLEKSSLTVPTRNDRGVLAKRDFHEAVVVAHTKVNEEGVNVEGLVNPLGNWLFERTPKSNNDLFQGNIYSVVVVAVPPSIGDIEAGEAVDVLEDISGQSYSFTGARQNADVGYKLADELFGTKYPVTNECIGASLTSIAQKEASDRKEGLPVIQYQIPAEQHDLVVAKYPIPAVCQSVVIRGQDVLIFKMHGELLGAKYVKLSSDDESGFIVYALVENSRATHWVVLMRSPGVPYDEVVSLLTTKSMIPESGNAGTLKPLTKENVGIYVDRSTGLITYRPRSLSHGFDDAFSYTVEDKDGSESSATNVDIDYVVEQRAASLYGYGLLLMMLILCYRQRRYVAKL